MGGVPAPTRLFTLRPRPQSLGTREHSRGFPIAHRAFSPLSTLKVSLEGRDDNHPSPKTATTRLRDTRPTPRHWAETATTRPRELSPCREESRCPCPLAAGTWHPRTTQACGEPLNDTLRPEAPVSSHRQRSCLVSCRRAASPLPSLGCGRQLR